VFTSRTPVIFILLGVDWKAGAGREMARGASFRKSLRSMLVMMKYTRYVVNVNP
jgi:hypothetical protein